LTSNVTSVSRDLFVTNIGKHVVKIRVSDTDTAKATEALATIVERTTFTNTVLPVTTCPAFPATPLGNGTGVHGALVTIDGGTDFGTHLLWQNSGLRMDDYLPVDLLASSIDSVGVTGDAAVLGLLSGTSLDWVTPSVSTTTTTTLLGSTNTFKFLNLSATTISKTGNQGFFSGSDWNVTVLAAAGMGNNVGTTEVEGAPFRVLFFDTDGTDNGLYVYSGTANYDSGDVTAINTNPTGSSAMGGKHTIVKVTAGKGHEIALSDINFV
jgi:hypothetical protein